MVQLLLDEMTFEHALDQVRKAASRRVLDAESVVLARAHGRVLAGSPAPLPGDANGASGQPALLSGCVMTPLRVAYAARSGASTVDVVRRPTVAVFSIGDALEPGMPPRDGSDYDGSRDLLVGLLRADGFEPTAWPRLPAEPRQVEIALRDAGCAFDSIFVCGCDDALERVRDVLTTFGTLDEQVDGVAFGTLDEACVLALPAEPTPLLGWYVTLGRILLDGLQGRREARPVWRGRTIAAFEGRTFQLVRTQPDPDGGLRVRALEPGHAGTLEADALLVLPDGGRFDADAAVDVIPLPMP